MDQAQPKAKGGIGWWVTGALGCVGLLAAPLLLAFLAVDGILAFQSIGVTNFAGSTWGPSQSLYGMTPLVVGSLATTLLAVLVVGPITVLSVIHLQYFASPRRQDIGEMVIRVLGGTPSVVIGLLGSVWLLPLFGPSLLSGSLVLALMIMPLFFLLAWSELRLLPSSLMEAGVALGLTRSQCIRQIILPMVTPRLIVALTVAIARALGEALAIAMVCGNVPNLPASLTSPVRTLTTTLVLEFEYASGTHNNVLHLVALTTVLLTVIVCGMTAASYQRRGKQ